MVIDEFDSYLEPQRKALVEGFLQECFFDSQHNHAAAQEILRLRARVKELEQKAATPARVTRSKVTKKSQEDEDTEDSQVGR